MATEEQILEALSTIQDPDLNRDIVSLGFVKNLEIDGGAVRFDLELTTPACPMKAQFRAQATGAVQALDGVESVEVRLTAQSPKQRRERQGSTLGDVDTILAVSSCKGGVGKSTVAAHLALAMQRQGLAVGLLDADIYGPSAPTLFNIHRPDMFMRENRILPIEADGLKIMSVGFLFGDAPAVLRGPIVSKYIQQLLTQTDWGKLDYLIVDMPPGTGDVQLTIVQQAALDGSVIVTTPQALSLVDVARGILMFEKVSVPVLGVVENMSYFVCGDCGAKHHIFGHSPQALEERFGIDTLAELPILPGVSDLHTCGEDAREAMEKLAENVHRHVGMRRVEGEQRPTVEALPGALRIRWPDGSEITLPNRQVRAACRCAQCVEEMSGEPLLDPGTIPEDIRAEEVQPLGNYAVAIRWSDGHTTGIYTWDHLRRLAEMA